MKYIKLIIYDACSGSREKVIKGYNVDGYKRTVSDDHIILTVGRSFEQPVYTDGRKQNKYQPNLARDYIIFGERDW